MRFTILGFSQKKAIELGLDVDDLLIIRWFVDFYSSSKMVKMNVGEKVYVWVNYSKVIEDIPILGMKKDMLYKRMKKICETGIMEHETLKQGGTFSLYRLTDGFDELISDKNDESEKNKYSEKENTYGTEKNPEGYGKKFGGGTEKNSEQNISILNDSYTKDKNNIREKRSTRFIPPTVEEVKAYCDERNNNIDPENFVDYYESKGWMIGRNKMKDWKASVRTWERNGYSKPKNKVGSNGIKLAENRDDSLDDIF